MERVNTGIYGFDLMVGGGIPRPSLILISGHQGIGKSTFGSQFLLNGTKVGEVGIYVSLLENQHILTRNMFDCYGFDFDTPIVSGHFHYMEYDPSQLTQLFEYCMGSIKQKIASTGARRIVIDPINVMIDDYQTTNMPNLLFQQVNRIHRIYKEIVMETNCIVIGIIEQRILDYEITKQSKSFLGDGEFAADGIITFEYYQDGSEIKKKAIVKRLRGSEHSSKYHSIILRPNEGISFIEMNE
jgi:KaiC/GvpD/RAD55 family RecA-like ATPase